MDKSIEVVKAAMEKEIAMKGNSQETMDQPKEEEAMALEDEMFDDVNKEDLEYDNNDNEVDETVEMAGEAENKHEKAGKSFFKNSKSKELTAKDQKIEELNDRLMRTMAEFDNFRKRSDKEKSQMYDMGIKSIIEKMLPIVDNFERGFGTLTEKEKESAFAQGIELIYRQLLTTFDDIGVKPIDAVGKDFDPNLHNAVMHGEDESFGENIVSDEFQKGYMFRDYVVRHSMVKVVN